MKNKLLSAKLKELRKFNNYNQDYVASTLGITRQTYSHYETGKRTPSSTVLYKFAGLYNISIDDFLQLTIEIDRNIKKYQYNAPLEKELLYYFEKLSDEDKKEMIEFTKIKARKNK